MHYITSYNKAWHASFQCYMSDLSNSIAISASISFHAMSSLLVNNETKLNEERMTGTKIKNISSVYWDFFYQLIKLIKKKNPFLPPRIENLKVPPWKKNFKDGLIAHGLNSFFKFFFLWEINFRESVNSIFRVLQDCLPIKQESFFPSFCDLNMYQVLQNWTFFQLEKNPWVDFCTLDHSVLCWPVCL